MSAHRTYRSLNGDANEDPMALHGIRICAHASLLRSRSFYILQMDRISRRRGSRKSTRTTHAGYKLVTSSRSAHPGRQHWSKLQKTYLSIAALILLFAVLHLVQGALDGRVGVGLRRMEIRGGAVVVSAAAEEGDICFRRMHTELGRDTHSMMYQRLSAKKVRSKRRIPQL